MGNYIIIKNRPNLLNELKKLYNMHLKLNPKQFENDFGKLNSFKEIFEINNSNQKEFRLKTGVLNKKIFTKEFHEELNEIMNKDFRFTDWDCEKNDFYDNWDKCKAEFDKRIKEEPEGRFSIYDTQTDEGVLFNEKCPDYN